MWDYFNAGMVKAAFLGPDDITFKDWFYEKALPFSPAPGVPAPPGGLLDVFFNSFIEGWWPYRHKSNVLMLHFNDMKADHEGKVLSRRPFGFLSAYSRTLMGCNERFCSECPRYRHQQSAQVGSSLPRLR